MKRAGVKIRLIYQITDIPCDTIKIKIKIVRPK